VNITNKPPMFKSNVVFKHTFRFTSSSGTPTAIVAKSLLGMAGTIGTVANTTVAAYVGSVKLNRIKIWSPPAAQGDFATCSVEFNASGNGVTMEYSDTSVSVTTPAIVETSPPPNSNAAFWQNPAVANNQLFTITAPTNSIIDVSCELILFDSEDSAQTFAVSTATVGNAYFLALDCANATHIYTPVSLSTTF